MKESDYLWRGMALNGQFRVLAVSSTNTVQAARDLHDLSPINTILMGKMIPAVAMLSLDLDRKSTRLNSSHLKLSRMPSSA